MANWWDSLLSDLSGPDMAPTAPSAGNAKSAPYSNATSAAATAAKSSGSGSDGISGAERRANAKESKAKSAASKKYKDQVSVLQKQASAISKALNSGYIKALNIRLGNIAQAQKQADDQLMEGYGVRVKSLTGAQDDNTKASSDASQSNMANRARERSSAVSEAMNNGAGESDVLKSQLMSLRSWGANQNDVNRSFYDGLRSINSSLGDLNVDTKTGRLNTESQANADRDTVWTQYYNQKSESYTQLGNIYGQQAELLGSANEMVSSKKTRSDQKSKSNSSGDAFNKASTFASSAWKNPGNSKALKDWKGTADFQGSTNNSLFENAATNIGPTKRPEGATLRTWSA